MKVLITGGAGYIGYGVVSLLEQQKEVTEITVFDNLYKKNYNFFTTGPTLTKTKFIKGDLLNKYDLEKVVQDQDIVLHMAAHVEHPYSYKDNFKYEQVNQYGTVVLYDLLQEYPPKKVIFMSSAAVYGFKNVKDEKEPASPQNYYGSSKLQAEKYLLLLQDQCDVFVLRSGNVFGFNPQVRLDAVINNFMFDALVYGKIKIFGKGNQKRPFIFIDTLTRQITNFMLSEGYQSGIYNLAQANLSLNELRDFLLERIDNLEFTYVDAQKELPSLSMKSGKLNLDQEITTSLNKALQAFRQHVRIS